MNYRAVTRHVIILLVTLCVGIGIARYAEASSCVTCHTNADIIKSLYHPPSISASEGEG